MRKILELYADDIYVEIDGQPHPVGEYIAFEDAPSHRCWTRTACR
jgi:hypothetical protein